MTKRQKESQFGGAHEEEFTEDMEDRESFFALLTYDNSAVYADQEAIAAEKGADAVVYEHRSPRHTYLHSIVMEVMPGETEDTNKLLLKVFPSVRAVKEDMVRSLLANGMYERGSKITDESTESILKSMRVVKVRCLKIATGKEFQDFITGGPIDWYMAGPSQVSGGMAISNNRLHYIIPGCKGITTLWDMTTTKGDTDDKEES